MGESDISSGLKALIETCEDAECGFRGCASNADSMEFQLMMTQRAATWHRWTGELRALPDSNVRCAVALRGTLFVDAALTGFSDKTLLAECQRIEEAAGLRYREVLEQELPPIVRAVVQRQLDSLQHSRARMRRLGADTLRAAA